MIKISGANRNKIVDAINSVEGKSQVNCLDYDDVLEICKSAEAELSELGIPVKDRSGAEYYYSPRGPAAYSYSYGQGATVLRIIRKSKSWFILFVSRIKVYPRQKEKGDIILTEKQSEITDSRHHRSYLIK